MARKRGRYTRYLGEQEIYTRVALDNATRAGSSASYNRRKPTVNSVGSGELQDASVTDSKISGTLDKSKINVNANNRWSLNEISSSVLSGRVKAASDIDWGAGKSVPAGKVSGGYSYNDLGNRPSLNKFLTKADVKPTALK